MLGSDRTQDRSRTWRRPAIGLVSLLVALPALGLTACAPEATFTVTSTTDAVDANPGDGTCATAAGDCSLRAAVQEANRASVPARIVLAAGGTYALAIPGIAEEDAATGDLDIVRPVTIEGNGATVDGAGLDRVLHVRGSGALTISDVTITHGSALSGGGLRVEATARAGLDRVSVTDNTATGYYSCWAVAGPFECSGGDDQGGGGVYSAGTLSINRSTISLNRSGIAADGCSTVTVWVGTHQVDGTVCASALGGGIASYGPLGLVNSTVSGNRVGTPSTNTPSGEGGGLYLGGLAQRIVSTTIAENQSDRGAAIAGRATVTASIVASASSFTCTEALTSDDWNIASDASCGIARKHDRISTDPQLGPLADNGGPTRTHLPAVTSPAVDTVGRAISGLCDGTAPDQRGQVRPGGRYCDVGSVERQPTDP